LDPSRYLRCGRPRGVASEGTTLIPLGEVTQMYGRFVALFGAALTVMGALLTMGGDWWKY